MSTFTDEQFLAAYRAAMADPVLSEVDDLTSLVEEVLTKATGAIGALLPVDSFVATLRSYLPNMGSDAAKTSVYWVLRAAGLVR